MHSQPTSVAAIDLGSNSFHLVVAHIVDGELQIVDKLKERVRLAAGLDKANRLQEDAQVRAMACLQRFGQRISSFAPQQVRAVGTNTLRQAVNAATFKSLAERALGHPIETIAGQEEARLIYLGVTHNDDDEGRRRLVVDIGGGSTECIVGVGSTIERADSLQMGCVSFSRRFFPHGQITPNKMEKAIIAARLQLGPVHRLYRKLDWAHVHGSSGTINAIRTVLQDAGWIDHAITPEALERLGAAMLEAGGIDALDLPGLRPDRRAVLPGGYAVLSALFHSFKIKEMHAARGALREGVVYDLIGRAGSQDVRDTTVRNLQTRFNVDIEQSERVHTVALHLFEQISKPWDMPNKRAQRFLRWGAALHEVGKTISFSRHHHHGAYLVKNTDMPGFSYRDHALLAALVLSHRRKLDRVRIQELGCHEVELAFKLAVCLRVAMRLTRTRSPNPRPPIRITAGPSSLHLEFPPMWLAQRPLTRADLAEEARYLEGVKVQLTWS